MEINAKLIVELCSYATETPWIEFKRNNSDPDMIGADISALANSATLHDRNFSYMIWGVDDATHEIVGTSFDLLQAKKGNQELENWLRFGLSQNVGFEFHTTKVHGKSVSLLIISKAIYRTVTFKKVDYIRVGSCTKKLVDVPSLQMQVWDKIRSTNFEGVYAKTDLSLDDCIRPLNYSGYFDLLGLNQPADIQGVAHYLIEEEIIANLDNGLYAITNLGAMLFAKRLADFPGISRKAIRVVQYSGINRLSTLREQTLNEGYALGLNGLMQYIGALVPTQEYIEGAVRSTRSAYPLLAVREAIANAIIHQDFSITGAGPLVEIFTNRIEITNPGRPLVKIQRIVDNPPRSRNEKLAALMRRLRMCEERGTGWDKMVISCELLQLPAPGITVYKDSTRVTLFSEIPFSLFSTEEKLWSCYLHACIKYVEGGSLTNSSLRERFGVESTSASSISRLIKEATQQHLIKPFDPSTAPRYMKYIPFWA